MYLTDAGDGRLANGTFSACEEVEPNAQGMVRARLRFSVALAAGRRQASYRIQACVYRSGAVADPAGDAQTVDLRAPDDGARCG